MGQNNITTSPPGKLPSFFRLHFPPRQLEMIFKRQWYSTWGRQFTSSNFFFLFLWTSAWRAVLTFRLLGEKTALSSWGLIPKCSHLNSYTALFGLCSPSRCFLSVSATLSYLPNNYSNGSFRRSRSGSFCLVCAAKSHVWLFFKCKSAGNTGKASVSCNKCRIASSSSVTTW